MASPRLLSAGVRGSLALSPSANGGTDETIWRQLREAGFDEETVKRKDKASLIAYITKLEAEVCSWGLIILLLFNVSSNETGNNMPFNNKKNSVVSVFPFLC
jgi:hypothetical protein